MAMPPRGLMSFGDDDPQVPAQGGLMGMAGGMQPQGSQAGQPQGIMQMASQGALLGQPQAQQGGGDIQMAVQMATMLAQNPSPQVVQQISAKLQEQGTPESQQIVQMLQKISNDPQALKQFAESIIQHFSQQ